MHENRAQQPAAIALSLMAGLASHLYYVRQQRSGSRRSLEDQSKETGARFHEKALTGPRTDAIHRRFHAIVGGKSPLFQTLFNDEWRR